jgi:hypothetical protein
MSRSTPLPTAIGTTTELLAASDSSNSICLLSRQTLEQIGRVPGHSDAISQVSFSKSNPAVLLSSSHDGTIHCWDLRAQKIAYSFDARRTPVFSFDIGGAGDMVLAGGAKEKLLFWDLRRVDASAPNRSPLAFTESHTEDITKVRFHPVVGNKLFTGSVDGLICLFDTAQSNEEDALLSVIPVDRAVSTFGFFGPTGADLYVVSTDQMLSLWNIDQAEELAKLEDSRKALENTVPMDYVIDCQYDQPTNSLFLLTGTYSGNMNILSVERTGITPVFELHGGHSSIIRCFDWNVSAKSIVTGGEDGRLCLWAIKS